ncbi:alternative ribosome rescue aminoacyl-tRNA hydrolase ArfB [Lutibacter sp.]
MDFERLIKELKFKAIRSSGAGGQHVNKVSSKVVLLFDLNKSSVFTPEEKELLSKNLKLSQENLFTLSCSESRSQHKNKQLVIERFLKIIADSLRVPKKRKRTKPSKSSNVKRLEKKKKQALKKAYRKKPLLD